MALLNQTSSVYYDSEGNIFTFMHSGEELYYSLWLRNSDKKKSDLLARHIEDFKMSSGLGDKGREGVYLFCYDKSGDIIIYFMYKERIECSKLKLGYSDVIFRDFRPYIAEERCEILISQSKKDNRNERLLSKYTININDIMKKDFDYSVKHIMEYCTFGPVDEIGVASQDDGGDKIISIIEKSQEANSIILLRDNRFGYIEGLIKMSMDAEIFWHDIIIKEGKVYIAYVLRDGKNFTIKLVIYNLMEHSLSKEVTIREKGNCSHPVIVNYMGEMWVCWFENGSVNSCVIDGTEIKEGPFKWKASTGRNIMCSHFLIDNQAIKEKYDFNCRKVFLIYPENNMTGFGR